MAHQFEKVSGYFVKYIDINYMKVKPDSVLYVKLKKKHRTKYRGINELGESKFPVSPSFTMSARWKSFSGS
jgi:hypothetical protein